MRRALMIRARGVLAAGLLATLAALALDRAEAWGALVASRFPSVELIRTPRH